MGPVRWCDIIKDINLIWKGVDEAVFIKWFAYLLKSTISNVISVHWKGIPFSWSYNKSILKTVVKLGFYQFSMRWTKDNIE